MQVYASHRDHQYMKNVAEIPHVLKKTHTHKRSIEYF